MPSCLPGTWSLLGTESDRPFLDARALEYNLTNERGVGGRIRLLRNVMGLWLLQECRRAWRRAGVIADYDRADGAGGCGRSECGAVRSRRRGAAGAAATCRRGCGRLGGAAGQSPPSEPGDIVRSILTSLACKYRFVLERLQRVTGRTFEVLHVVGGGARNRLLCQLTADLTGLPVFAGPIEATALGNVLVQAIAAGELTDLAQARELAAASSDADASRA